MKKPSSKGHINIVSGTGRKSKPARSVDASNCQRTYPPEEIYDWIEHEGTALCPRCGIDSVIGSASGYEITEEFLAEMNEYWFKIVSD